MANFTTHFTFGLAAGVATALATTVLAFVPMDFSFLILVGLATVIGSILPDIDSDSGIPFHATFGSLSIIAGGLAVVYALYQAPGDYISLVAYPLLAVFTIWVVIGTIFKKFTRHRGMAHSIPAIFLAGLLAFTLAGSLRFDEWKAFLLGLALALGYLLHLVLDEIYAATHGHHFMPNKSFGGALKLVSHQHAITIVVYGLIIFLCVENGSQLTRLVGNLVAIAD